MNQSLNGNEIRLDLRIQLSGALQTHLGWLNSLGQNAPRAALTDGNGRLLETLTKILLQQFPALLDIASHNPKCAHPAEWVREFASRVLHEVTIEIVLSRHERGNDNP